MSPDFSRNSKGKYIGKGSLATGAACTWTGGRESKLGSPHSAVMESDDEGEGQRWDTWSLLFPRLRALEGPRPTFCQAVR